MSIFNFRSQSKESGIKKINPVEAKKMLDNQKDIVILDVRTEGEYKTGHIKDSVCLPLDSIEKNAQKIIGDKEAPVFVYCRSGSRSAIGAKILSVLGYKNIYDLGGIVRWPYGIVK